MKGALIPALIGVVLMLVGLLTLQGRLVAFSIPFVLYMVVSLLYSPERAVLYGRRTLSRTRTHPGDEVEVTLEVHNSGPPLDEVKIEDVVPPGMEIVRGATGVITALDAGDIARLEYTVRTARGHFPFDTVRVTAQDRLGLLKKEIRVSAPADLLVYPRAAPIKRLPIRPRRTLIYAGQIPARLGGQGIQFFDVREYQPGDALRHINWRASARRPDSVFSNEYEEERTTDVGLILDARKSSNTNTSLFEHSVQAAASLAKGFLDAGDRVGLLIYGQTLDWTFPGYGKYQWQKIITALAYVTEGESQVFEKLDSLPTRLFPARSQIILISPLLPEDVPHLIRIRARGYSLLVLCPDPISFEIEKRSSGKTPQPKGIRELAERIARIERRLLFKRLEQAGIYAQAWDVRVPLSAAIEGNRGRMRIWFQRRG